MITGHLNELLYGQKNVVQEVLSGPEYKNCIVGARVALWESGADLSMCKAEHT